MLDIKIVIVIMDHYNHLEMFGLYKTIHSVNSSKNVTFWMEPYKKLI